MEAVQQTEGRPGLSAHAVEFLRQKYLEQDHRGRTVESPRGLFERVARFVARAEKRFRGHPREAEALFGRMMGDLDFLPNSPTLMNAGTSRGQLVSAYVLPLETPEVTASKVRAVQASGGGVGYDLGGAPFRSQRPVRIMQLLDAAARAVRQGGRRRGCNLAVMRVDNPQIRRFIHSKADAGLSNTGISVAVTDAFMQEAERGGEYAVRDPQSDEVLGSGDASRLLGEIAHAVWERGEPGLVFLDEVNRHNRTPGLGTLRAVSPCAEAALYPGESCILGSVNLANFVQGDGVDFDGLRDTVHVATRFLDDALAVNEFPLEETRHRSLQTRKIGIGVMGLADLLADLMLPYGSRAARGVAEDVMRCVAAEARDASRALADERGPYPLFDEAAGPSSPPMRNATTTAIAPTGSISVIAGCSSGIEPYFAVPHVRRVLEDLVVLEENARFLKMTRGDGAKLSSKEIDRIFQSSWEIPPASQVEMVAALQRHVDNGVSKTVYLPESATEDEVVEVFKLAHRMKCKGISVFRVGSLDGWILKAA